jgi:hypothetical protein
LEKNVLDLDLDLGLEVSEEMKQLLVSMTNSMLDIEHEGPQTMQVMRAVSEKMDETSAYKVVSKLQMPADVLSMAKVATTGSNQQGFDETSLEKARLVLNGMVEKSWKELDDKLIGCKEFEEQNRGSFHQVVTDISRLVEQISDLDRAGSEAMEGVASKEADIQTAQQSLEAESRTYNQIKMANEAELTIRQNDLDVFQFILQFTKCEDATSFLQADKAPRICTNHKGHPLLHFRDQKVQHEFEHKLTKETKQVLMDVLRDIQVHEPKNLAALQKGHQDPPLPPAEQTPVVGQDGQPCQTESDPLECMKSCPAVPPDCGLLHDKMSLMWGDYKDKVDSLTLEMMKNEQEYLELKATINDQIRQMTTSKARFAMLLAEARSNMAADREEKKNKEIEKRELEKEYKEFMAQCKKRIAWIMYQDMCAIIVVRNAVMETSTTCPTSAITDCEVDDWVPGECSVSCDDNCPPTRENPYACGGWQALTRGVVVSPDDCGLKCPEMTRNKKCNQFKCPVDCHLSTWSGWSKCTADCEGGVQAHTRSVLMKPRNGGQTCNTVEESRPCNTQSCDRDCTLAPWTKWKPCSVGCGGGFQERFRHVLVPIRGFGKCPTHKSNWRYQKQTCNSHPCNGDEVCLARQDLVIAIDGSGSVSEKGFNILKKFAGKLLRRYTGMYYGSPAMQVGLLQFGNGMIMPDGKSISPAINVHPLTGRMRDVATALDAMQFKKGFTNMAQAFALAETMFTHKGRGVQTSLMVITDGRPSFTFQTNEMVEQLDDKNVQRYFVVVTEGASDALDKMKAWASSPWETNLIHIPGVTVLDADVDVWIEKAVTLFCPQSMSLSAQAEQERLQGFILVKKDGFCGEKGELLSEVVTSAHDCASLAEEHGHTSFVLGTWMRAGHCYAGTMAIDDEQFHKFEENRVFPECPTEWQASDIYDFYAIKPVSEDYSAYGFR